MSHSFLRSPAAVALLAAAIAPTTNRLDGVDPVMVADSASTYALQGISMRAVASVQTWAESDIEMGEGEGAGDRLFAMLVGIADEDKDGELSAEEQAIVETAANEVWAYLSSKGVAEADLDDLFNSEDPAVSNAAGERVREFLAETLPDGEEAAADEMDDFTFGGDQAGVFDAVYKKRFAIKNGKKVIKRVRVAGTVRLSAKQKVAIRKASRKAHGARATMKRMKSMRVRASRGL
jgi:hypothetical protein